MKNKKLAAFLAILVLSLSISSCGRQSAKPSAQAEESTAEREDTLEEDVLTVATADVDETATADESTKAKEATEKAKTPETTAKPAETRKPTETREATEKRETAETQKPAETAEAAKIQEPAGTQEPEEIQGPAGTQGSAEIQGVAETQEPAETQAPAETRESAHEHSYTGIVTTDPTCTSNGVKTFSCSCGSSYTEPIPATDHIWVERYETITHEAKGEMQKTDNIIDFTDPTYVECRYCGQRFFVSEYGSLEAANEAKREHWIGYIGVDNDHARSSTLWDPQPIFEEVWVEIEPEWTETVVVGYTCSVCGATK